MRVVLVHNPGAGNASHSREELCALIQAAGHDVVYRSVNAGWATGLEAAGELVVAAGGDGTVRNVFRRLAGTTTPVTVLPLGTANNIARSLGVDNSDLARMVNGWADGRSQSFDVPLVTLGRSVTRVVESSGAGIFADVIARARDELFAPGVDDKRSRGLLALRTVLNDEAPNLRPEAVSLDGHAMSGEDLMGIEVLNTSEAGPNVCLAPEADPGDGQLDVVLIRAHDRDALSSYVEALLSDQPATAPSLLVRRAHHVQWNPRRSRLHADDELWGHHNAGKEHATLTVESDGTQVNVLVARSSTM